MNLYLLWFKNWLILCAGLFSVYIIFQFFEWFSGITWKEKIKKEHLLIKRYGKFKKKYGNEVSYDQIKEIINNTDFRNLLERPAWFELFETDKIIFFEIPWGEVYCKCTDDEYEKLIENIDNKFKQSLQKV